MLAVLSIKGGEVGKWHINSSEGKWGNRARGKQVRGSVG